MIYKGISGFYCFWSQSESREVLYWSIRYPRSHFFRTKTPEMNVSESLHVAIIFLSVPQQGREVAHRDLSIPHPRETANWLIAYGRTAQNVLEML